MRWPSLEKDTRSTRNASGAGAGKPARCRASSLPGQLEQTRITGRHAGNRLEEARKALERPSLDILDVALRFGFADQAHFTRLFKRRFGVPPGRFVRERAR